MLFNTIDFVIFFIIILTTIVIIKNKKFQHLFLLFASYFFFYYSSNYYITLLLFTTFWDFYLGNLIWKTTNLKNKKILITISIAGNLSLLGFFKYADFAITQFNLFGSYFDLSTQIPQLNLILPIGISFYTFHSIGYIIDIYRGKITPASSLREYAIFITFFPQLVAGPILRASNFLPQLREKMQVGGSNLKQIIIHNSNLKLGITIMTFGFFKKMFFADNIAPFVDAIFSYPIGLDSFSIVLGTIAFGIQIYCDFSGYSDIAIGAALILGFKIPINFNKPYFAISPSDFWSKWHISLSSWLKDYLYVPLGGNRKSNVRTYLNLSMVMFLGGLWHGASWNFVIWGVMHGVYLAIHKMIANKFPRLAIHSFFKTRIGFIFSILVTQYFIFLAWIPFRVHDLDYAIYSMTKFVFLDLSTVGLKSLFLAHKIPITFIILFLILHFVSYLRPSMIERISKFRLISWGLIIAVIMTAIVFFYDGNPSDFIYFRF